jgi:hypothetical protein
MNAPDLAEGAISDRLELHPLAVGYVVLLIDVLPLLVDLLAALLVRARVCDNRNSVQMKSNSKKQLTCFPGRQEEGIEESNRLKSPLP